MDDKKIVTKLIKDAPKYSLLASRPFTIQRMEFIAFFCRKFLQSSAICLPLTRGVDSVWLEKKAFEESYLRQSEAMLSPLVWKKQKQHYRLASRKLLSLSGTTLKLKAERQSLLGFFLKWQLAIDDFSYYFIAPFWVEDILFPRLQKIVKNEKDIAIISSPSRVFFYQSFQKELLLMGSSIKYSYLQEKYAALTEYSLKEELLSKKEIDKRQKEIKNNRLEEEINMAASRARTNCREFSALIKRLPQRTALLADIIHEYVAIRTERIETYQRALVKMRRFYHLLASFIARDYPGFNYLDAISLTNAELLAYLQVKAELPFKEIRMRAERKFFFCYDQKSAATKFIYQADNRRLLTRAFAANLKSSNELIKGFIVSKGKVRGKVRIIYGPEEFKYFKQGEILVSSYTSPAFMPIIKKAAALVTDEGGITSHAAIVSREMKVPCVTGTKVATTTLKNGDLVEVDADKGLVKIIKRK